MRIPSLEFSKVARRIKLPLIQRLRHRIASSVRAKLLLLVLAPLLLGLPILITLVIYWANTAYDRLLIIKINGDLVAAQKYFERVTELVGSDLQALAASARFERQLASRAASPNDTADFLEAERTNARLDFLNLLDMNGKVRIAARRHGVGMDQADWQVVDAARSGAPSTGIDVFSAEALAALHPELAERAALALVETRNAAPTDRSAETRGMMIHAAAPLTNAKGERIGVLQAGVLLNRNLAFVDRINDIVYREGSLPAGSHGTATLFLDDVRISTNVRLFQGERALGTRVSKAVRDRVLGDGETWLNRAFVVKDWYISAYDPILDTAGRRVGMLYVGYLEKPFQEAKVAGLAAIIIVFLLISVAGSVLSLTFARRIFKPLERMNATMKAVEQGREGARVGMLASTDEIGLIARDLDELLDTVAKRNAELKDYADGLDRKVAERTAELEQANQSLKAAQRQLVMAEKLAAIGQLTAGVAHEINNPIAVIQGNLDLMRATLGEQAAPVMGEIRLIDEQVNRVRIIVTKLLQFARPEEFAGYVESVDVNAAAADALLLVRHQIHAASVQSAIDMRATRAVEINRNELLQVLINLMVNALQAMPDGGRLAVASRDWTADDGAEGVELSIADTGTGISTDHLPRIFDPFFTTKKQQGTGLGLSISFALLERYGGLISCVSSLGAGTTFKVQLRCVPKFQAGPAQALPKV
ncbi:MAG: cache domain-containing protein [Betaproteobacteria bacterium]|nr:cache domain-containing protein [Betaproteobacteria bacterium]